MSLTCRKILAGLGIAASTAIPVTAAAVPAVSVAGVVHVVAEAPATHYIG